jgi:hypothetical protein
MVLKNVLIRGKFEKFQIKIIAPGIFHYKTFFSLGKRIL